MISAQPHQPILVAVDGSDQAALACRVATELSRAWHVPLHLVHVWQPYLPPAVYAGMGSAALLSRETVEVLQQGAAGTMAKARAVVQRHHGDATEHVVERVETADAILDVARDVDAGLVVAGRRGLGAMKRLFLGSVSEALLHRSTLPLLLLSGDPSCWPPRTVVAAVDGSEEATRASRLGAALAAAEDGTVHLIHAVPRDADFLGSFDDTTYTRTLAEVSAGMQERAEQLQRLSGAEVQARIELASPVTAILAEVFAGPAPVLVAMGTHGRGAAQRVMLGSVATDVLHDDSVDSVLIVPPCRRRAR